MSMSIAEYKERERMITDNQFKLLQERIERIRLATGSLADIVNELAIAAESGNIPQTSWVTLVADTIRKHKTDLGFID